MSITKSILGVKKEFADNDALIKYVKENLTQIIDAKKVEQFSYNKGLAVLEAMGEKCSKRFYIGNETGLWYYEEDEVWSCCQEGGNNYQNRTKTTLKQLIELLVSEQNEKDKSTVEEKIAVRVDNEKEFNALMKYYDSLGYNAKSGRKTTCLSYSTYSDLKPSILVAISDGVLILPNFDGYKTQGTEDYNPDNYKIIPFSDFAKEHGIRVPLLVSEDGVELFEGDDMQLIYKLSKGYERS